MYNIAEFPFCLLAMFLVQVLNETNGKYSGKKNGDISACGLIGRIKVSRQ